VDSVIPLNWSKIAGGTEGYVVQDLVDLTDKAIFQACKKAGIIEAKSNNQVAIIDLFYKNGASVYRNVR
jgi:hypothetical protein